MALKHTVYDTDAHFKIDPITRMIKNESSNKNVLIQHDHNSERFTFEIPRMVDGHDMSKCDVVQIHYINIDSQDKNNTSKDAHDVDDLQISPDGDDVVICSWLIDGKATKYAGSLNFLVTFKCIGDDGSACYVWHTAIFTGIFVSPGIDNGEAITEDYSDVLEQWRKELYEAAEKTHYTERVQVLARTDLDGFDGNEFILADHLHLITGQEYIVWWNGVEYICKAMDINGVMGLGNLYALDVPVAQTYEPFAIAETKESPHVHIYPFDGSARATISVYRDVIHELDNKYLDLDWVPKKKGTVILPAQIARVTNGVATLGAINAAYRVNGTKIIVLIDGIPHDAEIKIDGNDLCTDIEYGFCNHVVIYFNADKTLMGGNNLDGRTVEIWLDDAVCSKIPVEYLPDGYGSGGSGGSSAPSDWNADEGEPGHILNRPFYSEYKPVTLLETTTLTANGSFGGVDGVGFLTSLLDVNDGMECIVTYNGVEYTCAARFTSFDGMPCFILGNSYAFGDENTGEPFLVCAFPEAVAAEVGVYGGVIPLDGSGSFSISISQITEVVHKLPSKFMPEGVPFIGEGQTVIFPPTTLIFDNYGECDIPLGDFNHDFIAGETYTITAEGLAFNCVAQALDGEDMLWDTGLGNVTGETGEPFVIFVYTDKIAEATGIKMRIVFPSLKDSGESASVTLSILRNKVVHKLDEECLPDTALTRKTLVKNVQELSDAEKDDIRNEISPFNKGVTATYTLNVDGWEEMDGKYFYKISMVFASDSNLAIAFPADLDSRYPFYKHNCRYFYFNGIAKGVMCDTLPDKAFNVRFLLGSL